MIIMGWRSSPGAGHPELATKLLLSKKGNLVATAETICDYVLLFTERQVCMPVPTDYLHLVWTITHAEFVENYFSLGFHIINNY